MVEEHYSGLYVRSRGLTYYLTRVSNIRKTAGYEQYTYVLWEKDKATAVEDNPNVSYRLYSDKWYEWQAVPLF